MLSSETSRPTRSAPRAAAAALAAVVLLAACGGGKKDDNATGDAVGTTTTTGGLVNPDGSPVTDASGNPTGGKDTATTKPGGGPAKGPERNDIPLPGRYTYDYSTGTSTSDRTFDVYDAGERRGDVRQQTYFGSGDTVNAQLVVWFGTDLYYVEAEQRASGPNSGALCVWNPGFVELDLPLQVGKTWKADSTCTSDNGSRRRTLQAKVTGTEDVEVGGVRVKVWVIERTVETHTEAKGSNVTVVTDDKRVTTDRFSVDRHLLVRSAGTEATTLNGVPKGTVNFTLSLRSLTPAKVPGT